MNINVTLIGQMMTFAVLVIVTMRYIWPPIIKAMEARQATITKSLREAEERTRLLKESEGEASEIVDRAKKEALETIKRAEARAAKLVEEGKAKAQLQAQGLLDRAQADIEIERQALKEAMVKEIGQIVLSCSEKLLLKEIDSKTNTAFLDKLIAEVGGAS